MIISKLKVTTVETSARLLGSLTESLTVSFSALERAHACLKATERLHVKKASLLNEGRYSQAGRCH